MIYRKPRRRRYPAGRPVGSSPGTPQEVENNQPSGGGGGGGGYESPASILGPPSSSGGGGSQYPSAPSTGATASPSAVAEFRDALLSTQVTGTEDLRDRYLRQNTGQTEVEKRKAARKARAKRIISSLVAPSPEGEAYSDEARGLAPAAVRAARKTGVPASVLLALSGQESGYGTNLGPSSAGARGWTQFIPGTRDMIVDKYGVDPWKNPEESFEAAGHYLSDLGFQKDPQAALSGYSGGYAAEEYNNPILERAKAYEKLDRLTGAKGGLPGPKGTQVPSLVRIGKKAERKFGVEAREHPYFDPVDPVHSDNSMHYSGDAIDFQGDPQQLTRLNKWLARKYGSETDEMFYDPGINLADGQPTSAIGGHPTHVHFGLDEPGETAYPVAGGIGGAAGAALGAVAGGGGGTVASALSAIASQRGGGSPGRRGGVASRSSLAPGVPLPSFFRGLTPQDSGGAEDLYSTLMGAALRPQSRFGDKEEDAGFLAPRYRRR